MDGLTESEQWRDVPGWEGLYQASSLGRIRRTETGHILSPSGWPKKRLHVALCGHGRPKSKTVHRLVCLAFHGIPPQGKTNALHRNGDSLDNTPINLYWGSHRDNHLDAVRHGTYRNGMSEKTECKRGHPFDLENTLKTRKARICRTCEADMRRESKSRALEKGLAPDDHRHGTKRGYDYFKCRCRKCSRYAFGYNRKGSGMSESQIDKEFEKFFSTRAELEHRYSRTKEN